MTIKQILDAEELHTNSEIILDGIELSKVSFVAQVRSVSRQNINTSYKMDDGTGMVEVRAFNNPDEPMFDEAANPLQPNKESIEADDWVRVNGTVKHTNNRKEVRPSIMRKIKDMNEINYHLLEATYVHLYLTKGPPESLKNGNGAQDGGYQQQQGYGGVDAGANGDGGYDKHLQGVDATARKVFNCIKTEAQSNEGLHTNDIASRVGLPINTVANACHELGNNSLIFNTVDDDTWSVLEM